LLCHTRRADLHLSVLLEALEDFWSSPRRRGARRNLRGDGVCGSDGGIVGRARRGTVARLGMGERQDGAGRGGVPTNLRVGAPPAVLYPPARMSPLRGPTNNLKVRCEEVGKELGEQLLEEWDDPALEPWEVTRASGHRAGGCAGDAGVVVSHQSCGPH